MIRPDYLKSGDRIIMVSPSGWIDREYINSAADKLEREGFLVEVGAYAQEKCGVFAGLDTQRVADMQQALDRDDIKAIICTRGGYGSIRTIENLDWSKFLKSPKWIVGFSDITVFHSALNRLNVESIHGTMARGIAENRGNNFPLLLNTLRGEQPDYIWSSSVGRDGSAKGELVGGNLSILYSLRGTDIEYDYSGKILFIEDVSEYKYHLDRMLMNLKQGGVFNKIAGLVVGDLLDMKDGTSAYVGSYRNIIMDAVSQYSFPVAFDLPIGHGDSQLPLQLGRNVLFEVSNDEASIITE